LRCSGFISQTDSFDYWSDIMSKEIDNNLIEALEQERNEALERVVKRVKEAKEMTTGQASHSSHSSGANGRTHSSYVSA
jgi:hypothetical protein